MFVYNFYKSTQKKYFIFSSIFLIETFFAVMFLFLFVHDFPFSHSIAGPSKDTVSVVIFAVAIIAVIINIIIIVIVIVIVLLRYIHK